MESSERHSGGHDLLGMEYDEGPFYQTKRFDRYGVIVQQLIDTGHAYKCYCSKERLENCVKAEWPTRRSHATTDFAATAPSRPAPMRPM